MSEMTMTERLTFISCLANRKKKHKLVLREKCRCKQWFPSVCMAYSKIWLYRLNQIPLSKCKEQAYITSD